MATWNLGGQAVNKVATADPCTDIFLVQEVARGDSGWKETETDSHFWLTHRQPEQWRGVGFGVSNEIFDSVISRKHTSRGVVALVKLRGRGKLLLGSLHAHTGVTNRVYQQAVSEFMKELSGKWRKYPCILGVDVNEKILWGGSTVSQEDDIAAGATNLDHLCHQATGVGLRPISPQPAHRLLPTHYPRDAEREGRHIDCIWCRQVSMGEVHVDPEARHRVGSDHALLTASAFLARTPTKWLQSSRPRFVHRELPSTPLVDVNDIADLVATHTKPFPSKAYRDPDQVREAIRQAKVEKTPTSWKKVHKLRKLARHEWEAQRISSILQGDWSQYRERKRQLSKRSGWWGALLERCGEEELTQQTREHLADKLCGPDAHVWDEQLDGFLARVEVERDWMPFTLQDVQEQLGRMKKGSSVGPDGIGVDLLRHIAGHSVLAQDLVDIVNHIVRHTAVPETWSTSLLALLAKVDVPKAPSDLRPIAMSSAMQKLVSKLIMERVFPLLRRGTDVCCSGKNRQAADLVGCFTHLRDVTKEWGMPLVLAKLDIKGAFDSLGRHALAEYLTSKLQHCEVGRELKYLLQQLRPNLLTGGVPGGDRLDLWCTTGIRQGSPESAELFALVLQDALESMLDGASWKALRRTIPELEVELLMYQDDLFLWDTDVKRLGRRLELIDTCLQQLGLQLAAKKTAVTCTSDYVGSRQVQFRGSNIRVQPPDEPIRVLGLHFSFDGDSTRQAKELITRLRAAFREHRELLRGRASWTNKLFALKMLVEGTISWVAGAVYWSPQDMAALNTLQLHILRDIFGLRRGADESWVDYNQRTLRYVRMWMHANGCERWSTKIRGLQFGIAGHWCRQKEDDGRGIQAKAGLPARFLSWRNLGWWRNQQSISPRAGGLRHPRKFYPASYERDFAETLGCDWMCKGEDRAIWSGLKDWWLRQTDQPWCRGRQLAIESR